MMMQTSTVGKARLVNKQLGFSYIFMLIMLAVVAISALAATSLSSFMMQREREVELLFRGQAYVSAIKRYYDVGRSYPRSLEDLLSDPRFPNRHYLRKLYPDPFGSQWRLLIDADGGIRGIASQNAGVPIKKKGFPAGLSMLESAKQYSDWRFEYSPSIPK